MRVDTISLKADVLDMEALFENKAFIERLEEFLFKRNVVVARVPAEKLVEEQGSCHLIDVISPDKIQLLIQRCRLANVLWKLQQKRENSEETFLDLLGEL